METREDNFAEILKVLMKEKSLNQSQLADLMSIKQSQISEWLKGKAKPGYDNLKKLSIVFEVSADYLLGLSNY